ncbi:DUF3265 domain-containing protein [Vibrio vulnificus]|nr:DUF3265 domain-containing protein [Vibrio vulnificus]
MHAAWHFWFAVSFCGESGVRKLGLGGTHPLTQRYATQVNLRFNLLRFLRPFVLSCRQMSIFSLKFVVNSNRKTDKFLCLPQSVLVLACCQFSERKVWKEQVNRSFCIC